MIPADLAGQVDVAPLAAAAADLFTAQSYLIDRFVPDCEHVLLPAKTVPGGQIRYRAVSGFPAYAAPGRRGRLARLLPRRPARPEALQGEALQGEVGIDLRFNSPENWAHFLNIHLPLVFLLCNRAGLTPSQVTLLLPAAIPGYILQAARLLGLSVQTSDAAISGPGIGVELEYRSVLRPLRRHYVVGSGMLEVLSAAMAGRDTGARRVFLPRRGTRCLSNQSQIEAMLAARGYVTVYPETLSPADQFALFHHAETLVAVHGAGLAPLLYRQHDARLRQVVEILPCGHMTDVYRVMAQQVGCAWVGVRGRLKPDYVRPAYRIGTPFTRYSLDSFEADPLSLEKALAACGA